jgi:hypothetical protein
VKYQSQLLFGGLHGSSASNVIYAYFKWDEQETGRVSRYIKRLMGDDKKAGSSAQL